MMINDNFTQTYLKSLNLVKQDQDEDKKQDLNTECGDTDSKEEIISDEVDDQQIDVQADDVQDEEDAQTDDAQNEDSTEQGQDEDVKCFCFKTINKDLIDIINSGFDKVVFTVKAVDDEGKDTTTDIEISADAFEDFEECECEDQEEDSDEQSGEDLSDDEEFGELTDDQEGSSDDEDVSFESVFKKYYNNLITEEDEQPIDTSDGQTLEEENEDPVGDEEVTEETCPECGKKPCECEDSFVDNKNATKLQGGPKKVGPQDDEITECGDVCPECGEKKCTCEAVEEKKDKITKKTVKSAQEVQKLIEKDFGKKSKPWDLKQVKKVAFKNGKLFAASNDGKKWFNKQNKPIEL